MTVLTADDLYQRGALTLLAAWEEHARGATGASVRRLPGVAVAVFPHDPERAVYNNALLDRDLEAAHRAEALDALAETYTAAGIGDFAAWVYESDLAMRRDLQRRGYTYRESTRAMGMSLDDIRLPRPHLDLAPPGWEWAEYLRLVGVPPGFLASADPAAYHILIARLDGDNVATAMAVDHQGDRGIFNVGTLDHARRRGLGTGLTALLVHDARERGCQTASLQSTPMAERVYANVGFRDLGRFLEYGR
jgi:GNAT superfamily N-acetyltransferase